MAAHVSEEDGWYSRVQEAEVIGLDVTLCSPYVTTMAAKMASGSERRDLGEFPVGVISRWQLPRAFMFMAGRQHNP